MAFSDYFTPREGTQENVCNGGLSVIENLLYYLFKTPYVVWTMSAKALAKLRTQNILDIIEIEAKGSDIPYIVYLFRFAVYFILHAMIYLIPIFGPFVAIYKGIDEKSFMAFLTILLSCYYCVLPLRIGVSILQGVIIKYVVKLLLPILKFIFFPVTLPYFFLSYLENKCRYKAEKYTKKTEELK